MSITRGFTAAVSGMRANSARVGNISSNIANSSTVGFRRSFSDLVTISSGASVASGVRAVQVNDVRTAGVVRTTASDTDFAVQGEGFFVVSRTPDDPVESNYFLTRAGSFRPDAEGNLVNSAGLYLAGYERGEDGALGTVDRTRMAGLATANVAAGQTSGRPTTEVSLSGNLPSQQTGLATPGEPFLSTLSYVTPLGAADQLTLSWQPTSDANAWTVSFEGGGGTYGSVTVDFHDSGALAGAPEGYRDVTSTAAAPAGFAFDAATGMATVTVDNGATPQVMTLALGAPDGFEGMTQFAGDYTPPAFAQDGVRAGSLVRTELGEAGVLFGVFDNGQRRALFDIPVASVANPDGMRVLDGNAYALSRDAGALRLNVAGQGGAGEVVARALEGSNVDVAEELTDLITTQRAYSSNAKIVTTVDEMLEDVLRLKR